jgi:hypothetical protein
MYLEMLVGGGIFGGAAFAWLCWAAARQLATVVGASRGLGDRAGGWSDCCRNARDRTARPGRFVPHLHATYILIAVTLGLTSASLALTGTHTHRN